MKFSCIAAWKQQAKRIKLEAYTLYLACRDPRLPWFVRLFALCVAGYAFSPIDLIPDWLPIIGYLDDLILVPLGIALVIKMIPAQILQENREKARDIMTIGKPVNWVAAGFIIVLWLCGAWFTVVVVKHMWHK
ncbi:MAG TPA: YkvA family protein [Armatimonadota bacterium]|nr:YkvA family protein [Armatimonadota bacterium]